MVIPTIDTASALCIDSEIASSEDKPRGLVLNRHMSCGRAQKIVEKREKADLDEDDAICIVRV